MKEQFTGQINSTSSISGSNKVVTYEQTEETTLPLELDLSPNDQVARIRVAGGITKNLGNFESLRIDVAIELPSKNKKENIEKVYEYSQRFVASKIEHLKQMAYANLGMK